MSGIKVFISYSHKDEELKKKLENHLIVLKRSEQIEIWHDRKINAGDEFDNVIDENLKSSQIILLLISSDFIASNYCFEIEMQEALKLHDEKKAVVIPVILRDCGWHRLPFGKLMALPTDAKAITGKEWHNMDEAFTDVEKGIEAIIDKYKTELQKDAPLAVLIGREKDDLNSLTEAIAVYKIEGEKLDYKSTKEDFQKLERLKKEIYLQLFQDIELKIDNTPNLKSKEAEELFDVICTTDLLDKLTVQKIGSLRDDKRLYQPYERIIIISALSLSLLSFKKFNQKKANLLLDFLTDFEESVWEHALTGLVLALLHNKNKWPKFSDLSKRLELLKNIEQVQFGLKIIEDILTFSLFEEALFRPETFKMSFFNAPSNCFLPFYKDNPAIKNVVENWDSELNVNEFIDFVEKLPILNCNKYAWCLRYQNFEKVKKPQKAALESFREDIIISTIFNPYQNIISNYYLFFKYYPKENYENIFNNSLRIAKTTLKDIVLNKTNQLRVIIRLKLEEKNYIGAISLLVDLLKISPEDYNAHWDMAQCCLHLDKPNFNEALVHLLKLESINKKDDEILLQIAKCYFHIKKINLSLDYFKKAQAINPKEEKTFIGLANCYTELGQHQEALNILLLAEKRFPKTYSILVSIVDNYAITDNPELSNRYCFKILKFCSKDESVRIHCQLAINYENLLDYDLALEHAIIANETDSKYVDAWWIAGRIYFIKQTNLAIARKYLERSLKIAITPLAYGNLGHVELCEGNYDAAKKCYAVCLERLNDKDDFIKKINADLIFVTNYGISEERYLKIRDDVVDGWRVKK